MFKHREVVCDALIDVLGGREMLELMIDAKDFDPIYPTGEGLRFTFRALESDSLRLAKFVPMACPSEGLSHPIPKYEYQLRMTVEERKNDRWEMVKPYHCVDFDCTDNMVRTFEIVTHLALTF